MTKKQNKSQSN